MWGALEHCPQTLTVWVSIHTHYPHTGLSHLDSYNGLLTGYWILPSHPPLLPTWLPGGIQEHLSLRPVLHRL